MFYIVQLIKHKSSTKDSGSLWTCALHGQQLFAGERIPPLRLLLRRQCAVNRGGIVY